MIKHVKLICNEIGNLLKDPLAPFLGHSIEVLVPGANYKGFFTPLFLSKHISLEVDFLFRGLDGSEGDCVCLITIEWQNEDSSFKCTHKKGVLEYCIPIAKEINNADLASFLDFFKYCMKSVSSLLQEYAQEASKINEMISTSWIEENENAGLLKHIWLNNGIINYLCIKDPESGRNVIVKPILNWDGANAISPLWVGIGLYEESACLAKLQTKAAVTREVDERINTWIKNKAVELVREFTLI